MAAAPGNPYVRINGPALDDLIGAFSFPNTYRFSGTVQGKARHYASYCPLRVSGRTSSEFIGTVDCDQDEIRGTS